MRPKVKTIIDITKIPGLEEIFEDDQSVIHIGPLATHHHVVASDLIRKKAYVLTQASWGVGSPQLRNRPSTRVARWKKLWRRDLPTRRTNSVRTACL